MIYGCMIGSTPGSEAPERQGWAALMRTENIQAVVPARNEEQLLPAALEAISTSLQFAQEVLALTAPPKTSGCQLDTGPWLPQKLETRLTVIADSSTDQTASLASELADEVIVIDSGSAGAARAAGLLRYHTDYFVAEEDNTLLMCTDADSMVPREWVLEHLRHLWAGANAIAGTVTVDDWSSRSHELRRRYEKSYAASQGHVHGANLGIAAPAYQAVGGFASLRVGEDQNIVNRLRHSGFCVHECLEMPVVTSARSKSRVDAGFADYLNGMEAAL